MKAAVATVLQKGFHAFLNTFGTQPLQHLKVASAIVSCRTPGMGGQKVACDTCGNEVLHFHSCRNRHCPRCQTTARLNWVKERLDELLPVGYFHVVFTTPAQLNPFALRNKKVFYNLMFRAMKETILELAGTEKHLGADIGFIAVLHTWGQTLMDHPHIHCIVPGGGYDTKTQRWKAASGGFLFPIPVVRKLFRGKLMAFFTEAIEQGSIELHGSLQQYGETSTLRQLIDTLYRKEWVVYIKQPFASAQALVKYLGSYTHRVAISDARIRRVDDTTVSFTWKDYADHNRQKLMRLSLVEFIRRFMLHVLPKGFQRIRYYGFLAPRARKKRLSRCRAVFNKPPLQPKKVSRPWYETVKELTGRNPLRCPLCEKGVLRFVATIPRMLVNDSALQGGFG